MTNNGGTRNFTSKDGYNNLFKQMETEDDDLDILLKNAYYQGIDCGFYKATVLTVLKVLVMAPDWLPESLFDTFAQIVAKKQHSEWIMENKLEELIQIKKDKNDVSVVQSDVAFSDFNISYEMLKKNRTEIEEKLNAVCLVAKDGISGITIDNELVQVLEKTYEISTKCNIEKFGIDEFLVALVDVMPVDLIKYLKMIKSYRFAKSFFQDSQLCIKYLEIPDDLRQCLTELTSEEEIGTPNLILERDKELDQLMKILLKKNKPNAILLGEPGVGKSAIVESLVHHIVNNTAYGELNKFHILNLNLSGLVAGATLRGEAEERAKKVISFLESRNDIITFIDEVHLIVGCGGRKGGTDLANLLKPMLARDKAHIIGATTLYEYKNYISSDAALGRRFIPVMVKEPKSTKIYDMLKNKIKSCEQFHGVTISKELVKNAITYSSCFCGRQYEPDKTFSTIDTALAKAENRGEKVLTRERLLSVFDANFEMYDNMHEETKRITAYHEVGHLINMYYAKGWRFISVSIMPAKNYLGICCCEKIADKYLRRGKDAIIDLIAIDLGGRVAEEMLTHDYSCGASQDLAHAGQTARSMILNGYVDIMNSDNKNSQRTYVFDDPDENYLTDYQKDKINEQINNILVEALARSKKIIMEHKDELVALVEALVKKGMLSAFEVKEIIDKVNNEKESKKVNIVKKEKAQVVYV